MLKYNHGERKLTGFDHEGAQGKDVNDKGISSCQFICSVFDTAVGFIRHSIRSHFMHVYYIYTCIFMRICVYIYIYIYMDEYSYTI